jgi:hypothetical protein
MLDSYPPELQEFVLSKIASGEFRSVDEFAVEAAALYRDMDKRRQDLKKLVDDGVADIESGSYIVLNGPDDFRAFAEDIKKRGRERLRESAAGQ